MKNGMKRIICGVLTATLLATSGFAMTLEDGRDLLEQYYINDIPADILALPDLEEMTAALGDPYTYYMDAEAYADFNASMAGTSVVGIGIMVEKLTHGLRASLFAIDSPAEAAGMQVNDLIVAVNGTSMEEAGSVDAFMNLIPGEAGTDVTLTVQRGDETFDVTATRQAVTFSSVTGEVVDDHIGWMQISSFTTETGTYFLNHITQDAAQADRWVVDLRGNPGGSGYEVLRTLGYVMGKRVVAYQVDKKGESTMWHTASVPDVTTALIDEPMIILTDGNSASASELFSAAIRDYGYGIVIGSRTFGKGLVQNVFEDETDGSAMKLTTHRYYSPQRVSIDRTGVLPQIVVDADLADEVAMLLCGTENGALALELGGHTFYIHQELATSAGYDVAMSQLLEGLGSDAKLTLDGTAVTAQQVAEAWGVDYENPYPADAITSPYMDEINHLAVLGVIRGDEQGNFDPYGTLTRAELAALFCQAMGYWCWEGETVEDFADVTEADWYYEAVQILKTLGLLQGDENGNFNANDTVDYQTFLTLLMRVGAKGDLTIQSRLSGANLESSTGAKFPEWARPSAIVASQLDAPYFQEDYGILPRALANIDPTSAVTREQAALMMYRMLVYSGTVIQ